MRAIAYAFEYDGVLSHLHTDNRTFPLLNITYIRMTQQREDKVNVRRSDRIGEI